MIAALAKKTNRDYKDLAIFVYKSSFLLYTYCLKKSPHHRMHESTLAASAHISYLHLYVRSLNIMLGLNEDLPGRSGDEQTSNYIRCSEINTGAKLHQTMRNDLLYF